MSKNNQYESDAYLDQLSMEQLEDLLRADLNSPDEENDEAVFHILEVMKKREKENPTGRLPDKNKAWKEFQEYYNIPEGEGESLYPTYSEPENDDKNIQTLKTNEPRTRPRFRMRRGLVVAAILIVMFGSMLTAQAAGVDVFGAIGRWTEENFQIVMFGSMLTAQAAGVDVFGAIGRWTEENFQFVLPTTNQSDTVGINDDFQKASEKFGLPSSFVPTWCPEGFTSAEPLEEHIKNHSDSISCQYTNTTENKFYLVTISQYYSADVLNATVFEKDDSSVITYQSNGKNFYIFSNLENLTATWADENYCITITGEITLDQIKNIIDSIGE